MKKIIAITGARSEYDLLFPVYEKLNKHVEINFSIIITGPHLSPTYGSTYNEIIKDGFRISDYCFNLIDSDEKLSRVVSIGNQIPLIAQTLYREKPDLIIVAGDREDAISVALTAAYMSIPVAHFFGGDIAKDGNIDNSIRYATSKLASIHFVTLKQHEDNLIRMGEDQWRIHVVGNPAIDRLISEKFINKSQLLKSFNNDFISDLNYAVLIQHSIISEVDKQTEYIEMTLNALLSSNIFTFVNYPNSDPGSLKIRNVIDEYCIKYPEKFFRFKNLERAKYVNLLRHASFLIGNSSSGLLEAPSLGLPTINIGKRQLGRVHGNNILFVENNIDQISDAINTCLFNTNFLNQVKNGKNPYGEGDSSEKILDILVNIEINESLIYKNITY